MSQLLLEKTQDVTAADQHRTVAAASLSSCNANRVPFLHTCDELDPVLAASCMEYQTSNSPKWAFLKSFTLTSLLLCDTDASTM